MSKNYKLVRCWQDGFDALLFHNRAWFWRRNNRRRSFYRPVFNVRRNWDLLTLQTNAVLGFFCFRRLLASRRWSRSFALQLPRKKIIGNYKSLVTSIQ